MSIDEPHSDRAQESATNIPAASAPDSGDTGGDEASRATRIRIGSQRWAEKNPAARPKPTTDLAPPRPRPAPAAEPQSAGDESPAAVATAPVAPPAPIADAAPPEPFAVAASSDRIEAAPTESATEKSATDRAGAPRGKGDRGPGGRPQKRQTPALQEPAQVRKVDPPNVRAQLSPELEQELAEALGDVSLETILASEKQAASQPELEPESRHRAQVVSIHRDDVFVDLGARRQGVLSGQQFSEPPAVGAAFEVVVARFNAVEGLYEVTLPGTSVRVEDWSQVSEGMVVDAVVTGHNKGGLECQVNHLRGFIPASQTSLYRVEDMAQFVGQKFACVITEANPDKRNLVLSRRAMLEREKAEAKANLLGELEVGQVREAIVRSLQDFGAFVDLGGVDGLIHISQLSWDRIRHASEVLEVGQKVKVKIQKIDPATGKIGLAFRDLAENPWSGATQKFPARSRVQGTVTRITDFGAFVRLEAGIEGLVHISELSHKRVFRVSDVLTEGQQVEVQVVSVDPEQQRISLSLKALEARPNSAKKVEEPEEPEAAPLPLPKRKTPLKGGTGKASGGEKFGLKW